MKPNALLGVGVDALVLQGLAAGEAALTEAEKALGVLLIDIGGGTTNAAVFVDGSISHALVLPVGGHHLTNDIAIGLRVPFATAESTGLATKPIAGGTPWLMNPGTGGAHIMISPPRQGAK